MNEREALREIIVWASAYPSAVFPEPDFDKARAALEAAGISMDALHGSWARHLMKGVLELARDGVDVGE